MGVAPRLLVWNYSDIEKHAFDLFLEEIAAPPAVSIEKDQGHLVVNDIIFTDKKSEENFECDEKLVLFYNVPQDMIRRVIEGNKARDLPRPIFALVTQYSIDWEFSHLVEELTKEREFFRNRGKQDKGIR